MIWLIMISNFPAYLLNELFLHKTASLNAFIFILVTSLFITFGAYGDNFFWMGLLLSYMATACLIMINGRPGIALPYRTEELQRPKNTKLSQIISHYTIVSYVGETLSILILLVTVSPFLISPAFEYEYFLQITWLSLLILFYLPISKYFIVNISFLGFIKYILTKDFKIIVFRNFHDKTVNNGFNYYDYLHKSTILPYLGAYGNLTIVDNDSLINAHHGEHADTKSVLSHINGTIRYDDHDWMQAVKYTIRRTDIAVFHWSSRPTRSMIWELEQVKNALPESRMLFIESMPKWGLENFLRKNFKDDKPYYMYADFISTKYINEIYDFMSTVK